MFMCLCAKLANKRPLCQDLLARSFSFALLQKCIFVVASGQQADRNNKAEKYSVHSYEGS